MRLFSFIELYFPDCMIVRLSITEVTMVSPFRLIHYVSFWLKADLPCPQNDVRYAPNSVAKLFSGCRIVIIESLYQMKRIILTEIGTATNQCYAKFPWTEFCNRIGGEADIILKVREVCF